MTGGGAAACIPAYTGGALLADAVLAAASWVVAALTFSLLG